MFFSMSEVGCCSIKDALVQTYLARRGCMPVQTGGFLAARWLLWWWCGSQADPAAMVPSSPPEINIQYDLQGADSLPHSLTSRKNSPITSTSILKISMTSLNWFRFAAHASLVPGVMVYGRNRQKKPHEFGYKILQRRNQTSCDSDHFCSDWNQRDQARENDRRAGERPYDVRHRRYLSADHQPYEGGWVCRWYFMHVCNLQLAISLEEPATAARCCHKSSSGTR